MDFFLKCSGYKADEVQQVTKINYNCSWQVQGNSKQLGLTLVCRRWGYTGKLCQ